MQRIADWLEKLGISEYAQRFAESDVDSSVLRDLTDQDLKELGVSLGHRRKMLRAISELANSAPTSPQSALTEPKQQDSAERRQVTVMFSDLVGSTAMSVRMDPEDLREVISAYQKCVTETVRRVGGFVAKYMGDGVLIYFGYPQAHEHDAERAVRAGLELIAAVTALKSSVRLQTRVGIATGLVVVGDLIGSGEAQERGIVGETPNLGARLQGIAEPNMVVIAEGTRKLLGNLFELADLGPKDLKGIAGPVQAWAALRASSVESRFEAMHATGLTDLIGREEETELLLRYWSRAKTGEGQVVLLCGEAGIGKSRLTAALLERLASEPHTRLRYFCSPQHTESALYPIIGQMERAAGLAHDDPPQARLDKLDVLLAQTSTSQQDATLFSEMLSLRNDGRYPVLDLTPQERRQRTLEALTGQLAELASQEPVLMIFEDVHWIDPTTLEALKRTVDRVKTFPALLIITFRPDFNPPWAEQLHLTSLTLSRLEEGEAAAIVARLVGSGELPADVMAEIVERTDGIPLFVEEMTKAVLEAESAGETRLTVAAISPRAIAVPASLHASLMARLDRLGPAKEVAQVGAAIGREFSHALLASVLGKPEAEMQSSLDKLIAAGLIFRQGVPQHASYLFKHALVQDAAYGMMLRELRRALHARIAETLESRFAEIAEMQPEVLARHSTEAGLIDKAAALWAKAGQRSVARSALVEAAVQFRRALGQLATLPATPGLRREQVKLQVALASTLFHVKGYTSPETIAAFEQADTMIEQAEALGERSEDALLRYSVLYGQWTGNFTAGKISKAAEVAKRFLAVAENQAQSAPLVIAHRVSGATLAVLGEFAAARVHLDRAVGLYVREEHKSLATRFGQDIGVAALLYRSLVLYRLGHPESALRGCGRGIKVCARARPSWHHDVCSILCRHFGGTVRQVRRSRSTRQGFVRAIGKTWVTVLEGGRRVAGWLGLRCNRQSRAGDQITSLELIGAWERWTTYFAPYSLMWLAGALASCGRVPEAQKAISEALDAVGKTNERWDEAEIYRTAGELALRHNDPLLAESHFRKSLAIAHRQSAKSPELRAATSLALLWRNQGKRNEARELLTPIYDWFTEGFDMRDLMEAKSLLADLR